MTLAELFSCLALLVAHLAVVLGASPELFCLVPGGLRQRDRRVRTLASGILAVAVAAPCHVAQRASLEESVRLPWMPLVEPSVAAYQKAQGTLSRTGHRQGTHLPTNRESARPSAAAPSDVTPVSVECAKRYGNVLPFPYSDGCPR